MIPTICLEPAPSRLHLRVQLAPRTWHLAQATDIGALSAASATHQPKESRDDCATAAPAHQRPMWNISSNGRRCLVKTEPRGLSSEDGYPSAMTPSMMQDGGTPSSRTTSCSPREIPKYQAPRPSFTAANRISMMAIEVSTVQKGTCLL